jgi:hypothetical protein
MFEVTFKTETELLTVYPRFKIGWKIVLDQTWKKIIMQFTVLNIELPMRRKYDYRDVEQIIVMEKLRNPTASGPLTAKGERREREMYQKNIGRDSRVIHASGITPPFMREKLQGGFYYIVIRVAGNNGSKAINIGLTQSKQYADLIERELRQRIGLSREQEAQKILRPQ